MKTKWQDNQTNNDGVNKDNTKTKAETKIICEIGDDVAHRATKEVPDPTSRITRLIKAHTS